MDALLVDTHQVYLDGLECFFKTQRHSNLRKVLLDDSAADGLPEGRFDATVVGLSDESLHRVLGLVSHLGSRSGCKIAVLSDD